MKCIIGLGNPEEKYKNNRHNVGFMFVDYVANKYDGTFKFDKYLNAEVSKIIINNEEIILAKPQTFMNLSGEAVKKIAIKFSLKPADVFIAHDDLDIKLTEFKISLAKGPKLHNGIASIEEQWKTNEFWRIRIGVENRNGIQISGSDYVLNDFRQEEFDELKKVFDSIINHPSTPL